MLFCLYFLEVEMDYIYWGLLCMHIVFSCTRALTWPDYVWWFKAVVHQ